MTDQRANLGTGRLNRFNDPGLNPQCILKRVDAVAPPLLGPCYKVSILATQIGGAIAGLEHGIDMADIISNPLGLFQKRLGLSHRLVDLVEHRKRQLGKAARLIDQALGLILQRLDLVLDLLQRARRLQDILCI